MAIGEFSINQSVVMTKPSRLLAAREGRRGTASIARNGNAFVRGLRPYPTTTVPSAETPTRLFRSTHLLAVLTPAACNTVRRSCIPVFAVQAEGVTGAGGLGR